MHRPHSQTSWPTGIIGRAGTLSAGRSARDASPRGLTTDQAAQAAAANHLSHPTKESLPMTRTGTPAPAPVAVRLLTLAAVAEQTGLSLSTLRRAIRHRRLSVHRIGRCLRVSEADLAAFLGKRRQAAR